MPNLKFPAQTVREIRRGSQNSKSRSRDPFTICHLSSVNALQLTVSRIVCYQFFFSDGKTKQKQTVTVHVVGLLQLICMFTYCCLPLSIVCAALFYGQVLWSVIFRAINANPQPAVFRVTSIWRNATLSSVRCEKRKFCILHGSVVTFVRCGG